MDTALRAKIEQRRKILSAIKEELVERLDLEVEPEWIDDLPLLLDLPVHVRPGSRPGHADEGDRLPARNVVADRDERR